MKKEQDVFFAFDDQAVAIARERRQALTWVPTAAEANRIFQGFARKDLRPGFATILQNQLINEFSGQCSFPFSPDSVSSDLIDFARSVANIPPNDPGARAEAVNTSRPRLWIKELVTSSAFAWIYYFTPRIP